jgi:hypothetical protein
MAHNFANTVSPTNNKKYGFSVRLIQDEIPPEPLDFYLDKICSGADLAYVTLDDITGGTAPYYPANVTFSSEAAALATTNWSLTPNAGSTAVNYPETAVATYWVAVKDSAGDVFAKAYYADCWDSVAAARNTADLSANAYADSVGACGSSSTQNIYIAYRNPGTLSVNDRIFTTSSGNTPFNGTVVSEIQNWWYFDDLGLLSGCVSGTAVRINNTGFITDVSCC